MKYKIVGRGSERVVHQEFWPTRPEAEKNALRLSASLNHSPVTIYLISEIEVNTVTAPKVVTPDPSQEILEQGIAEEFTKQQLESIQEKES